MQEIKQEDKAIKRVGRSAFITIIAAFVVVAAAAGGLIYWGYASNHVYIEKSDIEAPRIDLSPKQTGILKEIYVKPGDTVLPYSLVARVDNQEIKAEQGGLVIATSDNVGKPVNPGEAVVSLIDPNELHAVGQLEEDKGLQYVQVGQSAYFIVDAFGSRKFYGTVDEVSPTSRESGIVFNISSVSTLPSFKIGTLQATEIPVGSFAP